jgi:hypothetical protein
MKPGHFPVALALSTIGFSAGKHLPHKDRLDRFNRPDSDLSPVDPEWLRLCGRERALKWVF